jgi:integrative and conjugative element protein (TIGR02256 family)
LPCLWRGGELRFSRPAEGVVEFAEGALAHLLMHRQLSKGAPEAGGVLLGRLVKGLPDIIVDHALGPSPQDRRGRFFFFRAKSPAQTLIDQAWQASGQTLNYLGEWHTHPEDDPSPSCIDKRDWSRISARARYEQSSLLFVIVGRKHLRVWEAPKTGKPIALSRI